MSENFKLQTKRNIYENTFKYIKTHPVHGKVLKVAGEALIDPDVVPPSAGNQVTEPLVSQLVRSDCTNIHFVQSIRLIFVEK